MFEAATDDERRTTLMRRTLEALAWMVDLEQACLDTDDWWHPEGEANQIKRVNAAIDDLNDYWDVLQSDKPTNRKDQR